MDPTRINQGEGDKTSARRYNQAATEHARSGEVAERARDAARAVAADPKAHREAEAAGKARVAEEDPEVTQPSWWTDEHASTWERVKAAVKRDWEQTLDHLSGGSAGKELDQSAMDTLRQMVGADSVPPEGEPTGVSLDPDWERAERATAFGYAAAAHYTGDWSPEVERQLSDEWARLTPAPTWQGYRPHVYLGWLARRNGL